MAGKDGTETDRLTGIERLDFAVGFSFVAEGMVDVDAIAGVASLEHADLATFAEIYIAYFDRAPDALGLFYWGTRLADGMGLEEIAASFFVQPETVALYPDAADNAALVDAVYRNLLDREADAAGRAYWIDALASGDVSRPEFMLAVINGAKAATGDPADAKVVQDKGRIGLDYAVVHGLTDIDNAARAMQAYDRAAPQESLARIDDLIAGYRDGAMASDEIVVALAGVADDPLHA